jgi:hypothetical protein
VPLALTARLGTTVAIMSPIDSAAARDAIAGVGMSYALEDRPWFEKWWLVTEGFADLGRLYRASFDRDRLPRRWRSGADHGHRLCDRHRMNLLERLSRRLSDEARGLVFSNLAMRWAKSTIAPAVQCRRFALSHV